VRSDGGGDFSSVLLEDAVDVHIFVVIVVVAALLFAVLHLLLRLLRSGLHI
jgi:hypothetical protein